MVRPLEAAVRTRHGNGEKSKEANLHRRVCAAPEVVLRVQERAEEEGELEGDVDNLAQRRSSALIMCSGSYRLTIMNTATMIFAHA